MTDDNAVARLRAELARQILTWMDEAFARIDFDAPPEKVVEGLTLAWSTLLHCVEEMDQSDRPLRPDPQVP